MKSLNKHILLIAASAVALSSCYRDLGNYEYSEINEIIITPGTYSYTTPKPGMSATVVLDPAVSQTMTEGNDNLSYSWRRQTSAISWEEVGNDPVYTFEVTSSDEAVINFIFAVTDNNLGITTYAEIAVNPIFAFEQCWFLLQNDDGQAVLGSVDGEGDSRVVTRDIYSQTTGRSLTGAPVGLGVHPYLRTTSIRESMDPNYRPLLGVFTSDKRLILNALTLDEHPTFTYGRLLYGKKYLATAENPSLMKGQRYGLAIVDDGDLWYAVHDELALMYRVRLDPTLGSDYNAADVCLSYGRGNNLLLFDSMGNRFLYYSTPDLDMGYNERVAIIEAGGTEDEDYITPSRNNTTYITSIGEQSADHPNGFDPEAIPSGFVIDDMSMCIGDMAYNVLATGHVGSTFHVYEFCMDALTGRVSEMPYCNDSWTVSAQGDLSAYSSGNIPATTSEYFTRLFFYAAGNSIYKVDLNTETPSVSLLWTAEDVSSVITGLKFKSDNEDIAYTEDGNPNSDYLYKGIIHQLGAVVRHPDGSCDLVEFEMTAAGEIEQNSAGEKTVRTFSGFTDVVDFVFSYKESLL